jgi:hypothetical protein
MNRGVTASGPFKSLANVGSGIDASSFMIFSALLNLGNQGELFFKPV